MLGAAGLAAGAGRVVRAPGLDGVAARGWVCLPPPARPPAPGPGPGPGPAPAGLFMIDVRLVLLWRYQTDIDHGRRGPGLPAAMIATVSPGRCAGNRYRESGQHYHLRYNTSVELKVARSC